MTLARSFDREQTIDWCHHITLLERNPGALDGVSFMNMLPALHLLQAHLLRHSGGDCVTA